ncbi:MAG: hypothetical protein PVJ78_07305 [Gammaproteobacteria bacterium]|jgi:hypothetical protein
MFGLMVFGVFALYVVFCIALMVVTHRLGQRYEWKYKWAWVFLVFLLFNTPVASVVLPPMLAIHSYCEESGFRLYKSPEQWKQENPGVAQTLNIDGSQVNKRIDKDKVQRIFHLNERFDWVIEASATDTSGVARDTQTIVDRKNGEVMAERIDFNADAYPLYTSRTCLDRRYTKRWQQEGNTFQQYIDKFQKLGDDS